MELSQLAIYVAAAEEGSFSAAAKRLYISHSTVCRTVASLEDELGTELIHRSNRVLSLTEAGRLLLTRSRELIAQRDELTRQVKDCGDKEKEI